MRELFENVPARRKFLRSADAEFRSIVTVVSSYALPLPERAFRLEHNGRVVLDLPPAATARERVLQILGSDAAESSPTSTREIGVTRATGYVTRGLRFGSRRNQFFFVNGRLVKDRVLTHAANRACEAFDFDGHPALVLFLELPPEVVDVNVHPAKTEVRFRDSSQVHVAVEQAIKRALGGAEEGAALHPRRRPLAPSSSATRAAALALPAAALRRLRPALDARLHAALPARGARAAARRGRDERARSIEEEQAPQLGDLQGRVIGQYRMSYILLDMPGGLRLVDQHVAHERVLYDRYLARVEARAAGVAAPPHADALRDRRRGMRGARVASRGTARGRLRHRALLRQRLRHRRRAAGAAAPRRRRVPPQDHRRLARGESRRTSTRVRERITASLACQAAIKVHRPLCGEEMARLVAELLDSSNPFACPHGRPIIVDIKHLDIERHFHRK